MGLVIDNQLTLYKAPNPGTIRPGLSAMAGKGSPLYGRTDTGNYDPFDLTIPIGQVKAIEVYPSPSSVPNELAHHVEGCGLIVVWTKYR
jgi:hypothetical protein